MDLYYLKMIKKVNKTDFIESISKNFLNLEKNKKFHFYDQGNTQIDVLYVISNKKGRYPILAVVIVNRLTSW